MDALEMDVSLDHYRKQAPISWLTVLLELHMIFLMSLSNHLFHPFKTEKIS